MAACRMRSGAIEHDAVAVAAVVLRVLVGLGDAEARLAAVGGHRARQLHLDGAAADGELQRRAAHHVDHPIVARRGGAGLADRIVKNASRRRGDRDVVDGLERRRLRRQQIVERVFVLDGLSRLREQRRGKDSANAIAGIPVFIVSS